MPLTVIPAEAGTLEEARRSAIQRAVADEIRLMSALYRAQHKSLPP